MVTAKSLHSGVIDQAHWPAEALAKLKPTQPLLKCFGSPTIRLLRTGAGKPIDSTSNFQPPHVLFKLCDKLFRYHPQPGNKFALYARRHEQFHPGAPNIDENSSFHERPRRNFRDVIIGRRASSIA